MEEVHAKTNEEVMEEQFHEREKLGSSSKRPLEELEEGGLTPKKGQRLIKGFSNEAANLAKIEDSRGLILKGGPISKD
ncbi:hypothetical protein ACLOJK_010162 [Asimina triloba]